MYKLSYAEIMESDCRTARAREQEAFDRAIELMRLAESKGTPSPEANEAVKYVQKLWAFFIENLSDPDNELSDSVKNDLISIGLWAIAEADCILAEQSKSFAPLIDINKAIRDGLS